jgi:hypothetical protein
MKVKKKQLSRKSFDNLQANELYGSSMRDSPRKAVHAMLCRRRNASLVTLQSAIFSKVPFFSTVSAA